jgi:hypothetical protein
MADISFGYDLMTENERIKHMKTTFLKQLGVMQIKKNIFYILFFICVLTAGIFLGFFTLSTPAPYYGGDDTAFSVTRMRNTIGEIAKEPHPVDTEAHERVCAYICNQMALLGLEPNNIYSDTEDGYVVTSDGYKNIIARLNGASDNAVLLVAHYDSARKSFGAADDGYGVATILETLRAIRAQNVPLLNDVMVLITDGEEQWMEGAKAELRNNLDRYKDVLLVLNVEASGMKGPPLMFETGNKNAAVVDYYAKYAQNPVAYSFTTAYYNFMPNDTDFSIFKNYGFNGLNFAVIDGAEYHHTASDSPENIDLRSLQHYGDQVFSIVKSFVSDLSLSPGHFNSNVNKLFFTIFPGVLVTYSETVSTMLAVAVAALFITFTVIGCVNHRMKPGKLLLYFVLIIAFVIALSLASEVLVWLLSAVCGKKFQLVRMYIAHAELIYLLVNITAVVLLGMFCWRIAKRSPGPELISAGILLNLVLSVLLAIFLTDSAYIVILPSLLASLYTSAAFFMKNKVPRIIILAFTTLLVMIIYVPVVTLVYQSLSIGMMGAGVLLCLLPFTTILPMFYSGLAIDDRKDCTYYKSLDNIGRNKMPKKETVVTIFTLIFIFILLLAGNQKQGDPDIFTTGIPMKDGKITVQMYTWEGELNVSGDKVIIKASDEQIDQLGDDGSYLAVKFLDQGTYFDEVSVDNITKLTEEQTGHNNEVTINLNSDKKIDASGDIEVYLRKTVITKSDEDAIVKIEEKGPLK